jgi:hypothetical protein
LPDDDSAELKHVANIQININIEVFDLFIANLLCQQSYNNNMMRVVEMKPVHSTPVS